MWIQYWTIIKATTYICEEGYLINLLKFINLWSKYHTKLFQETKKYIYIKGKFSFLIAIATCLNDQKEYSIIHMNKVEKKNKKPLGLCTMLLIFYGLKNKNKQT